MAINKLPPLSEWQTMQFRLTAFPSPDEGFDGRDWWEKLAGTPPDSQIIQPKTSEQIIEGGFHNGNLILSLFPVRINWIYSATAEQILTTGSFPVLGTFKEQVSDFENVMRSWLSIDCPSLVRLAFGAQVIQLVSNHEEAYNRLAQYVPVKLDPINSSDFLYRINRKRPATIDIPELGINRLSTWSALHFQGQAGLSGNPQSRRSIEKYAAQLELDINTASEFEGELRKEILPDLFRELITLGLEIAEKGDIA